MDEDVDENQLEDARKNRIKMYKKILNYYKGRSLSLDYILASKQPSLNVIPNLKTHETLCKDIQALYDDITLIQSVKKSLKLIYCSLASTEVMNVYDSLSRDLVNKIEGIIYFSKSIMKLYNECCTEFELTKKMKNYSTVLAEYIKYLRRMEENDKNGDNENLKEMEKAELNIYKVNLMRTMKSVLISYIALNCPNFLREVQKFKSSFRRELTIDDFKDTWDVGLSS